MDDIKPGNPTSNITPAPEPGTPVVNPVTPPPADPPVQAAPAASPPLGIPDSWPGAFGVYKYSKQAVKLNVISLIGVYLLACIIAAALGLALGRLGQVISYVADGLIGASFIIILLAGIRGQRISIGQALREALPFWLKIIGLYILVVLSLFVSFVLLVIPFFFVLPRLTLANYFLIDKKMGVVEAYKASWAATKGHAGKVWGIIGATFLMALLMITIIGIPFSIYFLIMYSGATAVLYSFIAKNPAVAAAAPSTAPAPSAAPVESPVPASDPAPVVSASSEDTPPTPSAPPTVQ